MKEINLDTIEYMFTHRKPGAVGDYQYYSVLVPLVKKDGELHILYEERAKHLDRQPGEVCFPGGNCEAGETPLMCATRETCEELGVKKEAIKVISKLDTLYASSGFMISSYLGTLDIAGISPSKAEVEKVFLVPLKYFMVNEPKIATMNFEPVKNDSFPYETINFPEGYDWKKIRSQVPIYKYKEHIIWGLTGRITHNFIKILKGEKK